MAIDGLGRVIIGNKLDERGNMVFAGNFNEFGHYAKASQLVTVILAETVRVIASLDNKTFIRNLVEPVHVTINVLRAFNKTFTETVHVVINTSRSSTRTYVVNVLISVGRTTKLTREFIEHLYVEDIFKRYFRYIFDETVTVTVNVGNTKLTRNFIVPVHITDSITKTFSRIFTEAVHITDSLIRKRLFTLVETVKVSVSTSRSVIRTYVQNIHIVDTISNTMQFVMKKLFSKARGLYRGAVIKIEDGRDVK